jgi:diguanylate cyclase (GGDEF)-like protein
MQGANIAQPGKEQPEKTGTFRPEAELRRSLLSLRWLVIILAAYLILFTHLSSSSFPILFAFVALFAATNIALAFVRDDWFQSDSGQRFIAATDILFIGGTFYLLRVTENYLYLGFTLVVVLAVLWRELKLVLFSLLVVSFLFGLLHALRIGGFDLDVNLEGYLTLSLFFVVSVFYIFLAGQLTRDARMSRTVLEEKRNAEVMVEITRGLSSSLKTQEVLRVMVNRVCDVLTAGECSIIGIDAKTGEARLMVQSGDPSIKDSRFDLSSSPELLEAYESRQMVFRDKEERSVAAVPMMAHDVVLGVIHVSGENTGRPPSESTLRFFEMMASTAANALRNAQLFEEVEHRARTDFLTGLPNHRYFQSTLSTELMRAQRHNHPLSLLMVDLDYLKVINDRFGHPSGDMVIRSIAETIRASCRDFDFAARYGGEEFAVILPETPLAGAIHVADRIREKIAQMEFAGIGRITASVGISNYPVNALSREDLIRVADQALYIAKNGGRDRVAYFNYQLITK